MVLIAGEGTHADDVPASGDNKEEEVEIASQPSQSSQPSPPKIQSLDPDRKLSQADKLIMLCERQSVNLFRDQTNAGYTQINDNGVLKVMPLRSRPFREWLANLLWQSEEKAVGMQALYSALNILVAKANANGKKVTLYNRVARFGDEIWIDMTDDGWRAIKVTGQGWDIWPRQLTHEELLKELEDPANKDQPDVPLVFKRYNHQQALPEPVKGGDPWKIFEFLNIDPKDDANRLVLLCMIISYLIPTISHPVHVVSGHQGSAKSWMFKLIKKLIDPSSTELLTLPMDLRELVQQLDHNYLAFYDNISYFPTWASDALCRAATGGGFSKRELYSDDDDVIYPDMKRCVGLNGINMAAQRGDLLDRSFLTSLHDIKRTEKRTDEELLSKFEACKREILGGFLDVLVKAIQIYPTVKTDYLFRMADFTRWGCAIAIALGKTQEEFMQAYEEKVNAQAKEAAHQSTLAAVLLNYLERNKMFTGTPTILYMKLLAEAKTLDISTRQKAWPKAPQTLIRQLNELAPSLAALGWEFAETRSGQERTVTIQKTSTEEKKGPPKHDACDDSDGSDAIPPLLSNEANDASMQTSINTGITTSVQEMVELLHAELPRGKPFSEAQFLDLAIRRGYTQEQADRLFESLRGKDIFMTADGTWMWA